MIEGLFSNVSEADKNAAIEAIIQHATPRKDFFLMLMLAVSMAAFGILLNSIVILVGSMLIAPLLYPILSLSLGIIVVDQQLMQRSIITIGKSIGYSVAAGFVIGLLFAPRTAALPLLIIATDASSSLIYAVVAAIAGFAAAFAMTKPYLNETLPGVAISVSLVPPLAAAGVALSFLNSAAFSAALLLFLTNVIGIVFSAMIVFALFRFSMKKTVTQEVVKQEEKVIQQETKKKES